MARRHVAFQRTGRIQCHADDNEQAGTTQLDGNAGQIADDHRHSRNDCQEHSADQSDLAQGLGDEIAGRLARTNAGDGAVVLAQLVADVYRIVLLCRCYCDNDILIKIVILFV